MSEDTKFALKGRTLFGTVVSAKANKTVTVEVANTVRHPRFHKYITRTSRYTAHDEHNQCKERDQVTIREAKPLSKSKRWVVVFDDAQSAGGES